MNNAKKLILYVEKNCYRFRIRDMYMKTSTVRGNSIYMYIHGLFDFKFDC